MATFHLIVRSRSTHGSPLVMPQLFQKACEELGVDFVLHDMRTTKLSELQQLGKGDMLYRAVSGRDAVLAEQILASTSCASFRKDWTTVFNSRGCSYLPHLNADIPVIPSVRFIPESDEAVAAAAEQLGGFPIVVKVLGSSHGVGVIRVDSLMSLKSLLDYLRSKKVSVMLRKYIPHKYYSRIVVVGNRVVASHITYNTPADFRTNADPDEVYTREPKVFPQALQDMAVKAVQVLGFECGGVDVLFDENDQPFVAEVNFPNDFRYTQDATGIDIAKAMVEHLLAKVK